MRKLILAFILLSFSTLTRAQSIKIPTDYEVGYSLGFEGHMLFAATEIELGIGAEGYYQTNLQLNGDLSDNFYFGIRYRWQGYELTKWEGTIGAGAYTYNIISSFPILPLQAAVRGSLRYEVFDKLHVGPYVFLTAASNDSDVGFGLVYKLY